MVLRQGESVSREGSKLVRRGSARRERRAGESDIKDMRTEGEQAVLWTLLQSVTVLTACSETSPSAARRGAQTG